MKNKESTIYKPGLVIALIMLVGLIIGGYFLSQYLISYFSNTENNQEEIYQNDESYNKLLNILNDQIDKTRIGEESPANEVTSFSYQSNHFYISGYNSVTIYLYDINLSSQSISNDEEAFLFMMDETSFTSYSVSLDRYPSSSSDEFINKYGNDGKYHIGEMGIVKKVFATMKYNSDILVINNENYTSVMQDTYNPTSIHSNHKLYNIYKYLIER